MSWFNIAVQKILSILPPSALGSADTIVTTSSNQTITGAKTYDPASDIFLKVLPRDASNASLYGSRYGSANGFGETRLNDIFALGYNIGPNAATQETGKGGAGSVIESFYAVDATIRQIEYHPITFRKTNDLEYRACSFRMPLTGASANQVDGHFTINSLDFTKPGDTGQFLKFATAAGVDTPKEIALYHGTTLNSYNNNSGLIQQANSSGSLRWLIFMDSSNRIRLGASGDPIACETNFAIGRPDYGFGTSADKVLAFVTGTAPTTTITDGCLSFSKDYAAGDARLFIKGEADGGDVVLGNGQAEVRTPNLAAMTLKSISENITIATGGLVSDSAANLLPADSWIVGVVARVIVSPPNSTDFSVGDAVTPTKFSLLKGTIAVGTTVSSFKHATAPLAPFMQDAAAKVRITVAGLPSDATGRIRVTVYYFDLTEPAS